MGNSLCDNSGISSSMEITRLKLVTDAASLLSKPPKLVLTNDHGSKVAAQILKSSGAGDSDDTIKNRNSVIQESEEDEVLSVGDETNMVIAEELLALDAGSTIGLPDPDMIKPIDADPALAQAIILGDSVEVSKGDLVASLSSK
ncbi:hypothetical protein CRG98_039724, partial [Punica granatum]